MEKQNERLSKLEADKCCFRNGWWVWSKASMQNSKEELEQYGKWLCSRINPVPVKSDETSNDFLK